MSTVKLNIREYKDPKSTSSKKVRFRIKNNHYDKSYQCDDIVARICDICKFDADCLPISKNYDRNLLIKIQNRQMEISALADKYSDYNTLKSELDAICKPNSSVKKEKDIIDYYEDYLATLKNRDNIAKASIKNHSYSLDILKRYKSYLNVDKIEFKDITKNWLINYRHYMMNENTYQDDYPNKTDRSAATYINLLKVFCGDAVSNGIIDVNPFARFTRGDRKQFLEYKQKDVVALTLKEFTDLRTFKIKQLPSSRTDLTAIRDTFVLQCYIGCRFSDLFNLGEIKYYEDKLGRIPYVEFVEEKNKRYGYKQTVALTEEAYKILKSGSYLTDKTKKKNRLYNQNWIVTYNKNIRLIFKQVGIDKEATSHLARRTAESLIYNFQPDMYLSGIHQEGSGAVKRYIDKNDMLVRLKVRCLAFGSRMYRLDNNDNILYTGEELEEEKRENQINNMEKMMISILSRIAPNDSDLVEKLKAELEAIKADLRIEMPKIDVTAVPQN